MLALEAGDISSVVAPGAAAQRESHQHHRRASVPESNYRTSCATPRSTCRDRRRRRSDAAGADRRDQALDDRLPGARCSGSAATRVAEANRDDLERARGPKRRYGWDASPVSTARLSMELWAQLKNEDWSLRHRLGQLAAAAVGLRQALPVHRPRRRRRRRLLRACVGRRGARQQETRAVQRRDSTRRRLDGRTGRAVDRGAIIRFRC